jgi:hypothetical protein
MEHLLFALIGDTDASMAMKACQVGQALYYVLFVPPNSGPNRTGAPLPAAWRVQDPVMNRASRP